MMTWEIVRQAIYQHFISEWGGLYAYFLEGQKKPDMSTETAPFVCLDIEPKRTLQIGMLGQTPPLRSWGEVAVTIFVPESKGAVVRTTAIDKLIEIFTAQTVEDITFQNTGVLSVVDGKGWRSQTVIANFYFEHQTGV